jgi:hypothetical protein
MTMIHVVIYYTIHHIRIGRLTRLCILSQRAAGCLPNKTLVFVWVGVSRRQEIETPNSILLGGWSCRNDFHFHYYGRFIGAHG